MNDRFSKKILLLFLGLLSGFLLLELLCRWISPPPHIALDGLTQTFGTAPLPCKLTPNFKGENDGVEIRTNPLGWRDRDWGPKSQKRILLVGDSFVLGLNVQLQHLLGRQIEDRFHHQIEVCMAGCIYYNTSNELTVAQRLAPLLKPDLILISYVLNDAELNHLPESSYQRYHQFESWLIHHSRLLFFTRLAIHDLVAKFQALVGAPDYDTSLYQKKSPGWQENRKAIKAFAAFSKESGCPVCFIIWPAFYQLNGHHPYKDIYKQIEGELNEAGLCYLNLLPFFIGQDVRSLSVSSFDTHPNAYAYQIAAQAVTDWLIRQNLMKAP